MMDLYLTAARGAWSAVIAVVFGMAAVPAGAASDSYDCVIEPFMVVDIGSSAEGVLESVMVSRGDHVTKGRAIARLQSDVQRATLELARTRANSDLPIAMASNRLELYGKEEARAVALYEKKVVATKTLDTVLAEKKQAELELRQARYEKHLASLEERRAEALLEERTIRSPIDAIVVKRMMSPGEYVHSQASIVTLAQIDPLFVEVYLPIALYPHIHEGMTGVVLPVEPIGGTHRAKVTTVDRVFDAASDTFGVRLTLPNPKNAMPAGINCTVKFPKDR